MLRGTDFSKYPAVRRFAFSLKHIATATGRIWFAFDRRHRIFYVWELIDQLSGLMDYNTGIHVIQTKDHIWKIGLYDTDLISV